MKTYRLLILFVIFFTAYAHAFTFQGELSQTGQLFDGQADFEFKLYDAETGGSQVGSSDIFNLVNVEQGRFNVELSMWDIHFDGTPLWLEISASAPTGAGFVTLSPRQEISPTPYALYSIDGNNTFDPDDYWQIGGNTPSNGIFGTFNMAPLILVSQSDTVIRFPPHSGISPNINAGYSFNNISANLEGATISGGGGDQSRFDCGIAQQPCIQSIEQNFGSIGGGYGNYLNANSPLSIAGTIAGGSANVVSDSYGTISGGWKNTATGSYSMIPGGLVNKAGGDNSFAAGCRATVRDASSTGDTNGDEGTFIWSDSTCSTFESTGPDQFLVRANGGMAVNTNNPKGYDFYVNGYTALSHLSNTGNDLVLGALNSTTDGDDGILSSDPAYSSSDLYFKSNDLFVLTMDADNSGENSSMIITTPSSFLFSVDSSGDVTVTGNLSKAGGSFKIDHPLDPENKYLYHSFVESPDMMNIYNGIVTTDELGEFRVEMPDWFEALNQDFRYQLTVIGTFAQAIIGEKMNNNNFLIRTSEPFVEVSWQVTGIRHDPWAEKNRIPVEENKPQSQKGLYLHPSAWGQSKQKGMRFSEENNSD